MSKVFNIILTICLMREKIDVSERFLNIYNRITDMSTDSNDWQANSVAIKVVLSQNVWLDRYERAGATAGLAAATLPTFWLI